MHEGVSLVRTPQEMQQTYQILHTYFNILTIPGRERTIAVSGSAIEISLGILLGCKTFS
jgi:hypothetical protein